jgi:DNA-binding transcriptional ArsR family regulator
MHDLSPDLSSQESYVRRLTETHEIRDLEALRTIADPLRLRIFEQLAAEPQTVKAVAAKLGLTPGRLYYHFNLLEEHGLIEIRDRRIVGNLVEKVYRAVASRLDVHHDLLSFRDRAGKENITSLAVSTLDATREDLVRSLEARGAALAAGASEHPRSIIVTRQMQCIPESRSEEFVARLKELLEDFGDAALGDDCARDNAQMYAFTVAFYPHFDYDEELDDEA